MSQSGWRILVLVAIFLIAAAPQMGHSQAKKKGKGKSAAAKAKAKADANTGTDPAKTDPAPTAPAKGEPMNSGPMNSAPSNSSPAPTPASGGSAPRSNKSGGLKSGAKKSGGNTSGGTASAGEIPDAHQLMRALSSSYRLNSTLVPGNLDNGPFLRGVASPDPALQQVARRSLYTIYLNYLLRLRKPPGDIAAVARQFPEDAAVTKLADFVNNRQLTTEQENQIKGVQTLAEMLDPSRDLGRAVFDRLFKDPQERESLLMPVRLTNRRETTQLLSDVERLASTKSPERQNAVRATLDRNSRQLVELHFTNQSGATLHHVLVTTRLTPDPKLVGKLSDAQIITRLGFPALSGESDKEYLARAAVAIRMEHEYAGMERGTMVYIPEVPAGAQVDLPLATSDDFALLRSCHMFLWSDELKVTALDVGIVALPQAQRLVPDRGGNVTMTVNITRDSPVDSYDYKLGNGKFCQVFELPLEQRVTYEVRSIIPIGMEGREPYRVCHLRMEDSAGKVVALESNSLVTNAGNSLTFTPPAAGMYRLICTSVNGESRCELWVRKKSASTGAVSPLKNSPLKNLPNRNSPNKTSPQKPSGPAKPTR